MRPLRLHWSYRPQGSKGKCRNSNDNTHPADIPLDAIQRPAEFTAVLQHWVNRDTSWHSARVRYDGCMRKTNSYDVDRLVAAANMFDLLPEDAVPLLSTLPDELEKARKSCLTTFKNLAPSIERDSVISALKRMNKPSLPKKVQSRVLIVNNKMKHKLPELELVAKTAIKVRNHFVHGESNSFNFDAVEHLMPFFTDALEFIFYASDLIEAGWDANAWNQEAHSWGHSFARFRCNYQQCMEDFKRATTPTTT